MLVKKNIISEWNKNHKTSQTFSNAGDVYARKWRDLPFILADISQGLMYGNADIYAVSLSPAMQRDKSFQDKLFDNIAGFMHESFMYPLAEQRTGSEPENTLWHIHASRPDGWKDVSLEDLKFNKSAFTINVAHTMYSTRFTSPENLSFDAIDVGEEHSSKISVGNFIGASLIDPSGVFSPNVNTVMLFRDNVPHQAPKINEERSYIIARNCSFGDKYKQDDERFISLPPEITTDLT